MDERDAHVPHTLAVTAAWSWRLLLVASALALVVYLLIQLFVVVVPILVALFLATVLEPVAAWLRRHSWHPALAAAVVFVVLLVLLGAFVFWLGRAVADQFGALSQEIGAGIDQLERWLTNGPLNLSEQRVEQLEQQLRRDLARGGVAQGVIGPARTAVEFLGGLILMFFVLFFLLKDGQQMGAWIKERVPDAYREDAIAITTRLRLVMQQYLAAVAITGLVDAVFIGLALLAIGVPLVLPLAMLTFVGGFFPIVGATAAGLVATLVAFVNGGIVDALLVVAATLAVQQLEGNLIEPLIMERAVSLHPIVTVATVGAGLILGGLVGAFIAVPIVASIVQVAHYYRRRPHVPVRV